MSLWYGKLYFYLSFVIDIISLTIYIAQNLEGIKLFNEYAKSMKMTKFYTNEAIVDVIFLSCLFLEGLFWYSKLRYFDWEVKYLCSSSITNASYYF